jgi:hypothetical protein
VENYKNDESALSSFHGHHAHQNDMENRKDMRNINSNHKNSQFQKYSDNLKSNNSVNTDKLIISTI